MSSVAILLAGGVGLGAYQARAYEVMSERLRSRVSCGRSSGGPLAPRVLHAGWWLGQRTSSDALRDAMEISPTLRLFFLRYVQALMVQTEHTALANAQALLEERHCRWLLMCHDRIDGDELPLTHEFLATMLGVRRPGATTAVQALHNRGLRGTVEVIDRTGLEVCADGIYGLPEAEYRRLVGISFLEGRS